MVDANILVAAFLRDSVVRRLLTGSLLEFLAPEFLFEELARHFPVLRSRAGLSQAEASELLQVLMGRVSIVPEESVDAAWAEASETMASIDPRDTAYVAAALAVPCDGVWSDDARLKRQRKVRCWTTAELLEALHTERFDR